MLIELSIVYLVEQLFTVYCCLLAGNFSFSLLLFHYFSCNYFCCCDCVCCFVVNVLVVFDMVIIIIIVNNSNNRSGEQVAHNNVSTIRALKWTIILPLFVVTNNCSPLIRYGSSGAKTER